MEPGLGAVRNPDKTYNILNKVTGDKTYYILNKVTGDKTYIILNLNKVTGDRQSDRNSQYKLRYWSHCQFFRFHTKKIVQ